MFKELIVSVMCLALFNSYYEVDKNFGPNSYCDKNVDLNYNVSFLEKEKEYFSKMCLLSQSEFEIFSSIILFEFITFLPTFSKFTVTFPFIID